MTALEEVAPVTARDAGEDSPLLLRLDSPGTRNALSPSMVRALRDAIERAVDERRPAIVFASSGPTFASGMDLRQIDHADDEALRDQFRDIQSLLTAVGEAPLVTIAAVDGDAVGAGADLALACDHRIGSVRSRFRFPGPQFGLLLGTHRLAKETSPATAQRLLLTGEALAAEEALAAGILTRLVGDETPEAAAADLAGAAQRSLVDLTQLTRAVRRDGPHDSDLQLLETSMTPGLAGRMKAFRDRVGGRTR